MTRPISLTIHTRALEHNLDRVIECAHGRTVWAVVKANAYGHGIENAVKGFAKADGFALLEIAEARRARAAGWKKRILLIEGFFDARDLPTISAQHFHTAVHNEEQLAALEEASLDEPVTVWMKLDTGMHRLGVRPEQAEAFYHRLTQCKNVRQPVNIVSHFARADEPKCGATEKQLAIFNTFCEGKPGQRSIAASGGILLWPQSHFDWVRPGIILYGISPFAGTTGADFGLQPVMTLKSSLIAVRRVKRGAKVGYGAAWTAPEDTVIGIVATGYGDGYPRTAPNGTPVWVNGRMVPTAGHVCMDMLFVNLGPGAADQVGAPVILWGKEVPVEKIAALCGTIPYELVCRIMPRVNMEVQA